jgi:hypothetical protein
MSMDDNSKVNISVDGLLKLLNKTYENFNEERDLALERYRRQDELINTADDFVLQGKFNVDYLKIASERSNALFSMAKLLADIQFKDSNGEKKAGTGMGDSEKSDILKLLREMENDKNDSLPTEEK